MIAKRPKTGACRLNRLFTSKRLIQHDCIDDGRLGLALETHALPCVSSVLAVPESCGTTSNPLLRIIGIGLQKRHMACRQGLDGLIRQDFVWDSELPSPTPIIPMVEYESGETRNRKPKGTEEAEPLMDGKHNYQLDAPLVSCHASKVASARSPWSVARRDPPGMVPLIAKGRNAATGQGERADATLLV